MLKSSFSFFKDRGCSKLIQTELWFLKSKDEHKIYLNYLDSRPETMNKITVPEKALKDPRRFKFPLSVSVNSVIYFL